MAAYCAQAGVDMRYENAAKQLVKEKGRVIGVICTNADNEYVKYIARKGLSLIHILFQLKVKGLLADLEIMTNTEVKTKMTAGSLNIRKANHVWMV